MSNVLIMTLATCVSASLPPESRQAIESYAEIVYRNYVDCLSSARKLEEALEGFLTNPNDKTLDAAKAAWLKSREPYGQSEVFRFYDGPIDFVDPKNKLEGPELRLNAWPLNEAYIDYVKGSPQSGIVHSMNQPITARFLRDRNAASDEKDVTTGYHAIEFLLWGQDHSLEGPGRRPVSDFIAGTRANDRRRLYLKVVTEVLIEDLNSLVEAWKPGLDNYRATFLKLPERVALEKITTGMAMLAGFELASERLAVPLDSGDQEDEHSCFSDNTHQDFIHNVIGLQNVYAGKYGDYQGVGLNRVFESVDPVVNKQIKKHLDSSLSRVAQMKPPFDAILASSPGNEFRNEVERLVQSLQLAADMLNTMKAQLVLKSE